MRRAHRAHPRGPKLYVASWLEQHEFQLSRETTDLRLRPGKHRVEQPPGALFQLPRPRNRQGRAARAFVDILKQEERQAAEMIAVPMAHQNQIDIRRIEL